MSKREFISKGQEKQIAILVTAVLVVFGFAIYRVVAYQGTGADPNRPVPVEKVGGGSGPAASTTAVAPTTNPMVSPGAPPTLTAMNDPNGEIEIPPGLTSVIDPFRRISSGAPLPPVKRVVIPQPRPMGGSLPPVLTTAPPPPPPVEVPKLTGLMAGPGAVACVTLGDKPYTVQKGNPLPNGMMVSQIDSTGVTLKRGKDTWRLKLGR